MSISVMATRNDEFNILKSNDDLMIGGYASIEIVDKQNDLITLKALQESVKKFMGDSKFRNVMTNHSNVQVGEVVDSYRDKTGKLWKSEVDDVGFFVVIKLRDDIEKAKEVGRNIRKGSLRSFSIGGQALQKVKKSHNELGEYNEISKLELHEVTICEKGINPEAKFDILKQDIGSEKMSEKLEKALSELDTLLEEVNMLRKEEEEDENMMERASMSETAEMADEEDMDMDDEKMEEQEENAEYSSYEEADKAYLRTLDGAGNQIGEPADRIVINNGKPTSSDMPVVKAFSNNEFDSLDLSNSNIEKAYAAFREEQLEALAYDNLRKSFETRFNSERANRENILAKSQYDAASEISSLKEEFTQLRKSLTAEKDSIIKAQKEATVTLPSLEDISEMEWSDIHKMVNNI
ncbi:HK97 family phage prohead protease [Euryarchaeota archaeon]|jgi:HK97 family phage prohead protease|nr:HK97 family phage prohead protease [Euryarchaeota archaeon]